MLNHSNEQREGGGELESLFKSLYFWNVNFYVLHQILA